MAIILGSPLRKRRSYRYLVAVFFLVNTAIWALNSILDYVRRAALPVVVEQSTTQTMRVFVPTTMIVPSASSINSTTITATITQMLTGIFPQTPYGPLLFGWEYYYGSPPLLPYQISIPLAIMFGILFIGFIRMTNEHQ